MTHLMCILLCAFIAPDAAPLSANVTGRIYDTKTMEALPEATIIDQSGRVTSSDKNGKFFLQLPEGLQTLTVRYVGYQSATSTLYVYADSLLVLNIGLDPTVTEIDQVVVSAGRVEQRVAESTVSVTGLRPEKIESEHLVKADDILNRTPGIEVLDGQASIRGGSGYSYGAGSRVLVMIDGLPAITPDAGSVRWHSLPLENISQIEVIKGASSVLYGSSALNGIVNFRTAEARPEGITRFHAETTFFGNPANKNWIWWDTPRSYHNASLTHNKQYGNTGISVGSFVLLDNGYRKRDNETLGRANFRIKRNHPRVDNLSYGLAVNGGMIDKYDFLLWENAETGALKQNPLTASRMKGLFVYVDPFVSFRQTDKQTHQFRMRIQASDNQFEDNEQNNSRTQSTYTEYQGWIRTTDILSLNAGVTHYSSQIRSNLYGDHTATNVAAYLQANLKPAERLTLVSGMRMEYNTLNDQKDTPTLLFRAGANYRTGTASFVRASFGQGYRYPSIAEKHAATTIGSVQIIPNPLIKPESGWNAEIGLKRGIITPQADGLVDVAVFYGQNEDMIEYVFGIYRNPVTNRTEPGFRAANIEYSRVYGTEAEIMMNYSTGRVEHSAMGGYVFMVPVEFDPNTYKNTGEYLKFRRKHALTVSLTSAVDRVSAGFTLTARSRILDIDDAFLNPLTREHILPGFYNYWQTKNTGYFVLDLRLACQVSHRYQLSLVGNNITNTEHMGRPGDIRPHRSFSVRMTATF